MRVPICLYLSLMYLLLVPAGASAETEDRAAILAVMERVFAAVNSGDPDEWRAIQLAEGTTISFRPNPNGRPGELTMRLTSNDEFVASQTDNGHDYRERWTGDPTVLIRGPIAVVWGEYEFWIDSEFSHCGIDSVDLVKINGEWKVANLMWTVETQGCPTDPGR